MYEMISGQRAFEAKSLGELRALHAAAKPLSLSGSAKDVDPAVERVVLRCLARDPDERPSSARAVLAALPGGDPLETALLAGETPSPEMVVAAAAVGDLSVSAAWVSLGAALLAVAVVLWLSQRAMLQRLVPLPKSTEVLLDRARTLAAKLAPGEQVADSAWGLEADKDYLREMAERDPGAGWERLALERPGPMRFWYRSSGEPLVARTWTPLPPWIPGLRPVGHVTRQQPPAILPGMQEVVLDPTGRLLEWRRVSSPADLGDRDLQASLASLLGEAGLDSAKLVRQPDILRNAQTIAVWMGAFPDAPGVARVVASIGGNRVDGFEVTRGDRSLVPQTFGSVFSGMTLEITVRVVLAGGIPIVVAIVTLAVRNLRSQRADRRGGFQIAVFGAVTGFVAQKLRLHFPPSASDVLDLWMVSDAQPIQWALVGWLYYSALEPELRRTWPHLLVSWSRLLKGRWRDPLVGTHVLWGATAGLIWACLWLGGTLIPEPHGFATSTPLELAVPALASSRDALSVAAIFLYPAVLLPLAWLVAALIFFRATRSRTAARVFLWSIFFLVLWNFLEGPAGATIMATLAASLVVAVVFRLGLLASAVMVYTCIAQVSLPPLAPGAWYAGISTLGFVIVVGLAVYGFLVSLAGKPAFGRPVLEG